mgnify:CR=1 FL=1
MKKRVILKFSFYAYLYQFKLRHIKYLHKCRIYGPTFLSFMKLLPKFKVLYKMNSWINSQKDASFFFKHLKPLGKTLNSLHVDADNLEMADYYKALRSLIMIKNLNFVPINRNGTKLIASTYKLSSLRLFFDSSQTLNEYQYSVMKRMIKNIQDIQITYFEPHQLKDSQVSNFLQDFSYSKKIQGIDLRMLSSRTNSLLLQGLSDFNWLKLSQLRISASVKLILNHLFQKVELLKNLQYLDLRFLLPDLIFEEDYARGKFDSLKKLRELTGLKKLYMMTSGIRVSQRTQRLIYDHVKFPENLEDLALDFLIPPDYEEKLRLLTISLTEIKNLKALRLYAQLQEALDPHTFSFLVNMINPHRNLEVLDLQLNQRGMHIGSDHFEFPAFIEGIRDLVSLKYLNIGAPFLYVQGYEENLKDCLDHNVLQHLQEIELQFNGKAIGNTTFLNFAKSLNLGIFKTFKLRTLEVISVNGLLKFKRALRKMVNIEELAFRLEVKDMTSEVLKDFMEFIMDTPYLARLAIEFPGFEYRQQMNKELRMMVMSHKRIHELSIEHAYGEVLINSNEKEAEVFETIIL